MTVEIKTNSGIMFDFDDPRPEMVCVSDIAYALSNLCRFGGHCSRFYSVASHSVLVHDIMALQMGRGKVAPSALLLKMALLHDATEAYCGDVVSPLKLLLPDYHAIERRIWTNAIAPRFSLPTELSMDVVACDLSALRLEGRLIDHDFGQSPIDTMYLAPMPERKKQSLRTFLKCCERLGIK